MDFTVEMALVDYIPVAFFAIADKGRLDRRGPSVSKVRLDRRGPSVNKAPKAPSVNRGPSVNKDRSVGR